MPVFIEVEAEVIDPHESGGVRPLAEPLPFGEAERGDGGFLLPFAGEETGRFSFNPKREVIAMRACEREAEFGFAVAVLFKLVEIGFGLDGMSRMEAEFVGFGGEAAAADIERGLEFCNHFLARLMEIGG